MRARPPVVLVAGILAIHVSTLQVLLGPGLLGRVAADGHRSGVTRLTLVTPAPVDATAAPRDSSDGGQALPDRLQPPTPAELDGQRLPRRDPPAPAGRAAAPSDGVAAPVVYRPPDALDGPIRPRSAPELSALDGVSWSGVPLRIRLFVDARGTVVDVQVLQSAEQDDVVQRVRAMFLATGFTPGMEHGIAVPCYKDIEMNATRVPGA